MVLRSAVVLANTLVCLMAIARCPAQEPGVLEKDPAGVAIVVRVPLPLTGTADELVRRTIEDSANMTVQGRPVVILEFAATEETAVNRATNDDPNEAAPKRGRGTSFERALSLARYLAGPFAARVRSVAYLPESIEGHAVLVALACEEIVCAPGITMGQASIDEPKVDKTIHEAYMDIQSRRQNLPVAAVQAMLDSKERLFRIQVVEGGERFVLESEWNELSKQGKRWDEEELSIPGQLASFPSEQMRKWRWISRLVSNHDQLREALRLSQPFRFALRTGGSWKPVCLELSGNVTARAVNQLLRGLEEASKIDQANILFLRIESAGGDLVQSMRLAQSLASLRKDEFHTVAWVVQAQGDAALPALACDVVHLGLDARLGGPGEATIDRDQIERALPALEDLAKKTGRSTGKFLASAFHDQEVTRWDHEDGRVRWATAALAGQWPDAAQWTQGKRVDAVSGIDGAWLKQHGWIRSIEPSLETIAAGYGLSSLPPIKRSNRVEAMVQRLAEVGWLPPLLIGIGFTTLMIELSTPGIGVPGFISALCFLLLFWIRFLNGTVEWLEVVLLLGGIMSIAIEFFVLPGFGIFGIGGLAMVVSALVLASQTFVWPTNPYQLNEMAWNMGQVATALGGILLGLFLIRNHLDQLPLFRRLALKPVTVEEQNLIEQREAVVHWEHLLGKTGKTVTRCNPAGKARLGDQAYDVLADGMMISEGESVQVVEVRGNIIVVRPLA